MPQEADKLLPSKPKIVGLDESLRDGSKDGAPPSDGIITDHKYAPMSEWWTTCRYCRLAQAAHAESEFVYYGDNNL